LPSNTVVTTSTTSGPKNVGACPLLTASIAPSPDALPSSCSGPFALAPTFRPFLGAPPVSTPELDPNIMPILL
ncbi:hypothetical protein C0993_012091, partial [Termitomyces sp. T159_Od127]